MKRKSFTKLVCILCMILVLSCLVMACEDTQENYALKDLGTLYLEDGLPDVKTLSSGEGASASSVQGTISWGDQVAKVGTNEYTYTFTTADGAKFEGKVNLTFVQIESIAITTQPTKKNYIIGETFDKTGMVVTATYTGNVTREVSAYTVDKTVLAKDDTLVTITYLEKTATASIMVMDSTTAYVHGLNVALAASSNEKHETMQAALDATKTAGFNVVEVAGIEILWDSVNNVFCYIKDGENKPTYDPLTTLNVTDVKDYQYWVIDSKPSSTYSTYLYKYDGTGTEDVSTGIDVGSESVSVINYSNTSENAQNVIVRTNGGTLTVNAPKDSIKHYGSTKEIEITSVSTNSFYEFGNTKFISIANGRLVFTDAKTAKVDAVYLTATNDSYNNIVLATMKDASLPETINRDAISDISEEKAICIIQTNIDSEAATQKEETIVIKGTNNVQDSTNGYTNISALGQKLLEAPDGTTGDGADYIGNKVALSSEEKVATKAGYVYFSGGIGTEEYPYLIGSAEDWANINKMTQSASTYYKQIADIAASKQVTHFAGTYDGNNYKLTRSDYNKQKNISYLFYDIVGHAVFKNINVEMNDYMVGLTEYADFYTTYGADFDNITFTATANNIININFEQFGFLVGSYIFTYSKDGKEVVYNFNNITNNVSVNNNGTSSGVFVGAGFCCYNKTTLNFTNCVNNGNITGTSSVGFLYGIQSEKYFKLNNGSSVVVNNCVNNGTLYATSESGVCAFAPKLDSVNTQYQTACGGTYISGPGVLKDLDITINQDGTSFSVKGVPAGYTYKLALNVKTIYFTVDNEAWTDEDVARIPSDSNNEKFEVIWSYASGVRSFSDLTIDENASGELTSTFKALDKRTAKNNGFDIDNLSFIDGYALVVKDGTTYVILDRTDNFYINSDVGLIVHAYNADGTLAGTKEIK